MHIGPYSAEETNHSKNTRVHSKQRPRPKRQAPRNLPKQPRYNGTGKIENHYKATHEVTCTFWWLDK